MKPICIIVIVTMFLSFSIQAQTVDEIIKNNLEAKGGVEKIEAIKSTKMTGKMTMQNFEMPFTMWFKKPNMVRMEMVFQGAKMTFAFNGKTVWQISPFTGSSEPQEVTGEQADQVKDTGDLMNEPFIEYQKKGHKIELIGKEDMEGTEIYKLKLTRKNGEIIYYYIDTESFIELKTSTTKKKKDGTEFIVETVFGDYKPVADVMMPHSLSMVVNQQKMGLFIETIEPNVELEENFFAMPIKDQSSSEKSKQ